MSRTTRHSVRRTLYRLTDSEKAKLAKHGFGSMYALEYVASEGDGAPLVESVLALYTQTGYRPERPEDEANVAKAKRRARTFKDDMAKGKLPARPRMGLKGVIASWAALWGIAVVFIPGGMYLMTITGGWVGAVTAIGAFLIIVAACGYIAAHGHFLAWTAFLPLLLVLIAVGGATDPLYLRHKGRDVQGELVRAWTVNEGKRGQARHCLVAYDDAGTRRRLEIGGCPGRLYTKVAPGIGEHVPVRFVLSPGGGVSSHYGSRDGRSLTWQPYTAGTGLVLLAGLTAWAVTGAALRRRVRAA
ncbi:hypothetical protein AB0L06_00570 [Spirillospora sp. NPDC052269]